MIESGFGYSDPVNDDVALPVDMTTALTPDESRAVQKAIVKMPYGGMLVGYVDKGPRTVGDILRWINQLTATLTSVAAMHAYDVHALAELERQRDAVRAWIGTQP